MALHYFHCTDGVDIILDRTGRQAASVSDAVGRAALVAAEVMRAVPDYRGWERWSVHVYDEHGELEVVPFPEAAAPPVH